MIQFEKLDFKKRSVLFNHQFLIVFFKETIHQKKRVLKNQTHFHDNDQTYLTYTFLSLAFAGLACDPSMTGDFLEDWTLSLWPGTVLIFPSWLGHWALASAACETSVEILIGWGVGWLLQKVE